MQKKGIILFIVFLSLIIVAIVVVDVMNNQTDNRPENPYALDLNALKRVDEALISHKETINFRLQGDSLGAILFNGSEICVTVDNRILTLDSKGALIHEIETKALIKNLAILDETHFVVGFYNSVAIYNKNGDLIRDIEPINERSILTALAVNDGKIMVADAGNRTVYEFNENLELQNAFEGKREEGARHGFIIPSANFDLAFSASGELWVVNPGLHAIENYDANGKMRAYWEATSFKIDGFSGCCNPAKIAIMANGNFVTSEKGIVRIKMHAASGEFLSVVAPPSVFMEDGKAPDVAVDSAGVVYALDYDKKMIRVFEPKHK